MTNSHSTRRSSIGVNNPSTIQERQAEAERVAWSEAGDGVFNVCVGSPGFATGNFMRWPITYDVHHG